uniref:Uncharacterized protein n=1 Tax=Salmo trutta TaxID=8032 RepID=A0A674BKI3_SALTR
MLVLHVAVYYMNLIRYIFLHQEDNEIPIHLRGGVNNGTHYSGNNVLHFIAGSAYVIYELVCASFPKKKE